MVAVLENGESPTGFSTNSVEALIGNYVLRFGSSKVEADLEGVFLTKGGTLGGAAARAETDFALSYSERSTTKLLTERHDVVDVPLSAKLVATSAKLFDNETGGAKIATTKGAGHVLLLSDRTRLLVTSTRMGASINGTLVGTMAGTAAVPLVGLFSTSDSFSSVSATDGSGLVHTTAVSSPPFSQIPVRYPNWDAINSTVGINSPVILYVDSSGLETPVNVAFFTPANFAKRMQKVEPVLKSIYDEGWKKTETVKFEPSPTLTKTITRKSFGFNGSEYSLACEVNDTPMSVTADTLESVLNSALEVEMQGAHAHKMLLEDLAVPSFAKTVTHSRRIANSLSAFAAFSMPYRVDGTPVVTPEGIAMVQAESWPTEATRSFGKTADDCDGSCQQIVSAVRFAVQINDDPSYDMTNYPNLRAVANSIGAHYVYGTNVLAANAGHAANANEAATAVAGHAIMMAVPKTSMLSALHRGSLCKVAGIPVVEPELVQAVTSARFNALYPQSLVEKMPIGEQSCFRNFEAMKTSNVSHIEESLQPLACEGTTFAKSTLYTHDPMERIALKEFYVRDKEVSSSMSPNITRTFKNLDVGVNGAHAFYSAFVEIGLSLESPLFTDPALRKLGHATPHFRFAKSTDTDTITQAGASPKELATQNFSVVPLWVSATNDAALIDEAHHESISNTMPMRGVPMLLSDESVVDINTSIATLRELDTFLHEPGKTESTSHETAHIVSFAALLHNQKAIEGFCDMVRANKNTTGEIYGLDTPVKGIAVSSSDPEVQLGRYITLELMVALED